MPGRPDLLIVGGGPAGLAVAINARLAGFTATVLDRRRPPIDKPCGEGLMPDGAAALGRLGIAPAVLGGCPFRGIRYLDRGGEGAVAEGEFPGGLAGLGVRRTRLHAALVARAEELGVDLRWAAAARGLLADGGRYAIATAAGPVAGRWLVGADGLRSPLRRWAGLAGRPCRRRRFGVRRHYRVAPWSDCVEVWWGERCEAYVTPVGADEVGVAMLWSPDEDGEGAGAPRASTPESASLRDSPRGFDDLLAAFPRLAARLAAAEAVSKDRGAGPLHQRPRAVHRGNLALVGDAAGYLDAITGEGLALALHQAEALVAAIARGDLRRYAAAHRRLCRLPDAITALLLAVERRPRLLRRTIRALAAEPALFSRLLGVHARSVPLSDFGMRGAMRLVWGLARA